MVKSSLGCRTLWDGAGPVKLLTEYLERAVQLERLAEDEADAAFKDQLLKQAAAYRTLAAKRAEQYGLPRPGPPEKVD